MSRPYHITASDADLCRRAGVDEAAFTEPRLGPFPHRMAKLGHLRTTLAKIARWRLAIQYGSLGYRIEGNADMAQAKRMELSALQGKWLLEAEDDALEEMLLGPAVDEVLGRITQGAKK